jgi:flagellar FliL protein
MSSKPADDETDAAPDGEGGKKVKGKKLLIFIILGVVLLLGGGGAALYFTGVIGGATTEEATAEGEHGAPAEGGHETKKEAKKESSKGGHGGEAEGEEAGAGSLFLDLPVIKVNLASTSRKTVFAMIGMSLALENEEDKAAIQAAQPRIVDSFQTYLRELSPEELRGSAGLLRLREELLLRVNAAVAPVVVKDVLFQQVLVQ